MLIKFIMRLKYGIYSFFNKVKFNRGMTYVELIVVLSIFSIMSSMVMFNYGAFQARVDIKNLANDIAIKIVEAQKASTFGKLPSVAVSSGWKPTYGVYFSLSDNKNFTYFVDLDSNKFFDGLACLGSTECINKVSITKGNYISSIMVFYLDSTSGPVSNINLSFIRPSLSAEIKSTPAISSNINYVQITITSPKLTTANIKLYRSGRVQIN